MRLLRVREELGDWLPSSDGTAWVLKYPVSHKPQRLVLVGTRVCYYPGFEISALAAPLFGMAQAVPIAMNSQDLTDDPDAADTLRFTRDAFDAFDKTQIYDLDLNAIVPPRYVGMTPARRRQIRDTRENVLQLRAMLAAGSDIGPELAYEERKLAALESAS